MAKAKKQLVISNDENFDQKKYDQAVGKLIRQYKKAKTIQYDELSKQLAAPFDLNADGLET